MRCPPSVAAVRIVSLLPSATEILFELGLGDDVVGVTFECNFPPAARSKRIVSTSALPEGLDAAGIDAVVKERMAAGEDLYRLDRDVFADLDPDLVVTQDLCAVCAVDVSTVDDAIAYLGCRAQVLTLDPMTLDEVLDSILDVGAATGTDVRGRSVGRAFAGPTRRHGRARRRWAATNDTRARMDRPCVHGRTLGARSRHGSGRRMSARPAWPTLGGHRLVDDRVVGRRGRDRSRRVDTGSTARRRWPTTSFAAASCPLALRCGPSMPMPSWCVLGRASSTASSCSPRSSTRTSPANPTPRRVRI